MKMTPEYDEFGKIRRREIQKVSDLDRWRWCDNREFISRGQSRKGFFKCVKKGNIYYTDCKNCKDYKEEEYEELFRKFSERIKI